MGLDGDLVRVHAPLAATQQARESHGAWYVVGRRRTRSEPGVVPVGLQEWNVPGEGLGCLELALELAQARVERLELLAGTFEHGNL